MSNKRLKVVRHALGEEDEEKETDIPEEQKVHTSSEEEEEDSEGNSNSKTLEEDDVSEDEDIDEDNDDNRLTAVGSSKFASAIKKILHDDENTQETEIFQRKTKLMKLNDQETKAKVAQKQISERRKQFDLKGLITLPETNPTKINRERELKRIATRGVVALFNAIGAHQRAANSSSNLKSVENTSKESFLKMLTDQALGKPVLSDQPIVDEKKPSASTTAKSSWKVLQEDYLEQGEEDFSDEEPEENIAIIEGDDDED